MSFVKEMDGKQEIGKMDDLGTTSKPNRRLTGGSDRFLLF